MPAGIGAGAGSGGSIRPTGTPSIVSRSWSPKFVSVSTPTTWPEGTRRDEVPMPPLKPRQLIPVPAPTAPSAGGRRLARRPAARAASRAMRTSVALTCIRRESDRKLSSHSATTGMITSSTPIPGLFLREQLAGRVVDAADLHGRGEEHRRLGEAPLGHGQEPGALARAVQHRAAGGHRGGEQVPAGIDHGDAGPGHAPARRRRRLVPPHRDVADADAGHVGDRRGRAGRQDTYPDAKIAGPGGLFIGVAAPTEHAPGGFA